MKNLEIFDLDHRSVGNLFNQVEHFAQITDNNYESLLSNYLYFIKNNNLYALCLENGSDKAPDNNNGSELEPIIDEEFADVVSMRILPIECHIHVVTKQYLYIIDRIHTNIHRILHKIRFEDEIIAANWSPTDDTLITITSNGHVRVIPLGGTYEEDDQIRCHVDDKIPDTVYVGWGSEKTQFRGSEGKLKPPSNDTIFKEITDKSPKISWRGNGELVAINYFKDQQRHITIFNKFGQAQYRSELCPGLQSILAWRPSGNMLATIVDVGSSEKQWNCCIFEKNGQKRFSFEFNCDSGDTVIDMKWSHCSRILAILTESNDHQQKTLHLLTTTNYKWYKKLKLIYPKSCKLLNFDFIQQFTTTILRLRIITACGIVDYKIREIINRNNCGVCGVINDNCVQITDFKDSIIPPPLYLSKITTNHSINSLKFSDNSRKLAIINCENHLEIYNYSNCQLLSKIDLDPHKLNEIPVNFYNLQWFDDQNLIIFGNFGQILQIFRVNLEENRVEIVKESDFKIDNFTKFKPTENTTIFDEILPDFYAIRFDKFADIVEFADNFHLNSSNILICNSRQFTKVQSFTIFNQYLLFTTKLNQLFCINLHNLNDTNIENYCRPIEQGGRIVCCIPDTSLVVLQLPRGNIETISCRLIAIDLLDDLLDRKQWKQAIDFIRAEKLNINLLYDLNPIRFCQNIENFIRSCQLSELTRICLEFDDKNCLTTIYKHYCIDNRNDSTKSDKIETIFRQLFNYFDTIDYIDLLPTIVVINYHFFTLKDSLLYLQDAYRQFLEIGDNRIGTKLKESIENLKHYNCDDLKLFNTILSLYDLELAKFVINLLQIDPRYYQQLLDKYQNLPEIERRYQINLDLKQPQIAIGYLLNLNDRTDDLIQFIKSHNLYRQSYRIVDKQSKYYQLVSKLYGEHLCNQRSYRMAGIVLKRAGLYREALNAFRSASDYRNVLELLGIIGIVGEERDGILNDLCRDLIADRNYKQAAFLYENYLNQSEIAVDVLIDNSLWFDALFLIKKYKFDAIFDRKFVPNLLQFQSQIRDKLSELLAIFSDYHQRLSDVRLKNVEKFVNDDDDGCFDDLYSDTSSVTTRSNRTRTSTQSSRNRRKDERKRQDLRPGGQYEDIALIRAIFNVIQEIYSKSSEVNDCCLILLQEDLQDLDIIGDFYRYYSMIYQKIQNSLNQIWPSYFYKKSEQPTDRELSDLKNFEFLDVQYRIPPQNPGELKIDFFK